MCSRLVCMNQMHCHDTCLCLSAVQAYAYMAAWLLRDTTWTAACPVLQAPPDSIPEELQRPLKRLKTFFPPPGHSGLIDDISDIYHLAGRGPALTFAEESAHLVVPDLPEFVQQWYA